MKNFRITTPRGRLKTSKTSFCEAKTNTISLVEVKASTAKTRQNGMTLIEVLVSVFVLTIGVLALLATQLRTVSGIREAESRTIVAQAVQNLVEGMLANPDISSANKKTGWRTYSYSNYLSEGDASVAVVDDQTTFDKKSLAAHQLVEFSSALANGLPEAKAKYRIYEQKNKTFVEVTWQNDTENKDTGEASALVKQGSRAVYTYQAQVSQ